MSAVVLYRQVTSEHRTRFTKRAHIHWSLASLQSVTVGWNDTQVKETIRFNFHPIELFNERV